MGGLLLAAAALAALGWVGALSLRLVAGLALLAVASALGRLGRVWPGRRSAPVAFAAGAAVAGAAVLTSPLGALSSTPRLTATAAGAGLAAALWQFDRRSAHAGLGLALVAVAAAGLYATVPDTEEARVLLAVVLPLGLLAWPRRLARLGPAGATLVAGLLLWVAATGGHARPGAVVGGLAAAGLLLADPLARAVAGRSLLDRVPAGAGGGAAIVAAQAGLALAVARMAGLREGAGEAALVAVPLLVLVAVVLGAGRGAVSPPTG